MRETYAGNLYGKPMWEIHVGNPCGKSIRETYVGNPCGKSHRKLLWKRRDNTERWDGMEKKTLKSDKLLWLM